MPAVNLMLILECWGTGGTEQYVQMLSQALKSREPDWTIHLVVLDDEPLDRQSDSIRCFDECTWLGREGGARWRRLRQLVKERSPDICHLHLYSSTLPAVLRIKLSNAETQIFLTFHSPISQWSIRHRAAFRLAVALADKVIGASALTASQLHKWRQDVVTASPAIAVHQAEQGRLSQSMPSGETQNDFRIVGCGRLSREKDWGTLIQAVSICQGQVRPITCELIGDGPERMELDSLIDRLHCDDRVRLVGMVPHVEALKRVGSADLFVLPSRFEGFGIAAVEAMSLGVPTITANFPASSEYIRSGETGHTFPVGDSLALAELIRWHVADPGRSQQLGRDGRTSVITRFSLDQSASLHRQLYQTAKQSTAGSVRSTVENNR